MLKMEEWRPKDIACSACRDIGIVIPRDGQMPIEVGRFCSECQEGVIRWREVMRTIIAVDGERGKG